MPTPQRSTSINELARDIVAADPSLQRMLKGIVRKAIAHADYTLDHGSSTDKMQLMRTLTPHMLEALRQSEQNDKAEAERQAYERIRAALKGEIINELTSMPPIAPVTG